MNARVLLSVLLLAGSAGAAPSKAPPHATARPAPTTKKLTPSEIERAGREAIAASAPRLPKSARIVAIRCATTPEVPIALSKVTIDVTPAPKKAGSIVTTAVLVFWRDADVGARVPITIELDVPASALVSDAPKGTPVTLVVTRGLVEVTAPAVTSADADVGDVIQVLLKPSGRAMKAKLVAKDRAVIVEEPS
jgi:hypothetical protein